MVSRVILYMLFIAPGDTFPEEFIKELMLRVRDLERKTGKTFGSCTSAKFPLLLSVRGSSAVSLPQWGSMSIAGSSRFEWQSLPDSYSVPGNIHFVDLSLHIFTSYFYFVFLLRFFTSLFFTSSKSPKDVLILS